MLSPESTQPVTPDTDTIRTRALGCAALLGTLLLLPVICAVLFYFVSVAAQNYWAMVASVKGVF